MRGKFAVLLTFVCIAAGCDSRHNVPDTADVVNYIDEMFASTHVNQTAYVDQCVKPAKLPEEASFAGEPVPLNYIDVRESLQRELTTFTYWHGSMTYIMQLAGRFQPVISQILEEEGIHPDFFYLCVAESSLQPLFSPAGAAGYWQFLASTAKQYGLEVGSQVDERFNVEKSTRAACRYFKDAYEKFGTWTLAAASYNIGMKNISDRIEYQSLSNYYDMQLPIETARYVYRAIAFKIIMTNPRAYGFDLEKNDLFRPFACEKVIVNKKIKNWSDFAAEHGTNFKMLKMCNEWIRSNHLDNRKNKSYEVLVPVEGARMSMTSDK